MSEIQTQKYCVCFWFISIFGIWINWVWIKLVVTESSAFVYFFWIFSIFYLLAFEFKKTQPFHAQLHQSKNMTIKYFGTDWNCAQTGLHITAIGVIRTIAGHDKIFGRSPVTLSTWDTCWNPVGPRAVRKKKLQLQILLARWQHWLYWIATEQFVNIRGSERPLWNNWEVREEHGQLTRMFYGK